MSNDFQTELVKALVGSLQTSLESVERNLSHSMEKVDCACRDAVGELRKDVSKVAVAINKVDKDQALMNERLQKLDKIEPMEQKIEVIEKHTKQNSDTIALVTKIFHGIWIFLVSSGLIAFIGSVIQNVFKQLGH